MSEEKKISEENFIPPEIPKGLSAEAQLGILVLDGSGSMESKDKSGNMTKAEAVGKAVKELIELLKKSSRKDDFYLSIIVFSDIVQLRLITTQVVKIDLENLETNPYIGGETAIGDALEKAGEVAREFLDKPIDVPKKSVVIMLMSDGQNVTGKDPKMATNELMNKLGKDYTICTAAYGEDADKKILKELATGGEKKNFIETDDAKKLRSFFQQSMVAPASNK